MTAASLPVTAVRGMVATWPGRILAIVLAAVVVGAAVTIFRGNNGTAAVTYRTAEATKASLAQTVAISGSVNPAGQARLNFRSAGRISAISVTVGQQVTTGQELARIEATDLENALANAQNSLASAQSNLQRQNQSYADAARSLDNARKSADTDVANAQAALAKMKANYAAARTNYLSLTSAATSDIPTFQSSLDTMQSQLDALVALMNQIVGGGDTGDFRTAYNALFGAYAPLQNARANSATLLVPALSDYQSARSAVLSLMDTFDSAVAAGSDTTSIAGSFQLAQTNYQVALSRLTSALDTTSSVIATLQGAVSTAQAALNTSNTKKIGGPVDQWRADLATLYTLVTSEQQVVSTVKVKLTQSASSVSTLTDAINGSYVTAVQNVPATIDRTSQTVQTASSALASKPADIQSAQNSVDSAQLAVQTAQTNLDYAILRAPSAGIVQAINGTVGEPASSSTTTPVVLLANTGTVQLHGTVGEADVSKLKLGLVANITIDALGATTRMTGKVTGVDPVATIQQGVPVYGVDVTIDVPNASIRPGMSGTANVILVSHQDVLTVPNLAIKTQGTRRYLQVLKDGQPVDVDATFGISNDTLTEVTGGGLKEGDLVILPQARAGATTAPNRGGQQGGPGGIVIR
ncbi:MAG: HlyD family efflux transporter periplasmic adaptor subunit [Chloroflexi bacterium]|nr:MAG: HlyD family efflux transporter periplasmic adaptor subunit [Chloroflexota bacterium]